MMKYLHIVFGIFLLFFGALSLFMTFSVVFDLFGIREMEGNYVPIVLYANMVCGGLFVFSGMGFIKKKIWTSRVMLIAGIILTLAGIALYFHINNGGLYEQKTIKALSIRTLISYGLSLAAYYLINKRLTS